MTYAYDKKYCRIPLDFGSKFQKFFKLQIATVFEALQIILKA